MRNYKDLWHTQAEAPNISTIKREILAVTDWEDAYWLGSFLYEKAAGEADKLIMDAYEKAFQLGLNINTNREYYLNAAQKIAKIYFQFQKYDEASNMLMILDANVAKLPDWVHLYFASVQIQTENILNWAENIDFLFKHIDVIDESNVDSVRRRKFLYLEFLNRLSELSKSENLSTIAKDAIIKKAEELDLADSEECLNFKLALGIIKEIPAEKQAQPKESADIDYEEKLGELNNRLIECQNVIDSLKRELTKQKELNEVQKQQNSILLDNAESQRKAFVKEIEELTHSNNAPIAAADASTGSSPSSNLDVFAVDNFLQRGQKILIIGGSETKESNLRGKLKSMGFTFAKDQLDFQLDYDDVKEYVSRIKPWSRKYAGIIVGPCPHKAKDIGGYSSFISKIKSEQGYPHVEEGRDKAGNLKISNSSIGDAMLRMSVHLQSIG